MRNAASYNRVTQYTNYRPICRPVTVSMKIFSCVYKELISVYLNTWLQSLVTGWQTFPHEKADDGAHYIGLDRLCYIDQQWL